MPASQDEHAQFSCQFCPRTFGRQEHLTRHIRAHTREKPYSCSQCNKSFSRQDVLQRHQVTHSSTATIRNTVSARACKECAAGRIRCSRELPCGRCKERSLECIYPNFRRRKTRSMTQQGITNLQSPATSTSESPNGGNEAHDEIEALVAATEETSAVMENNPIDSGVGIGWVADEHQSIAMASSGGLMTTASLPGSIFQINDVGGLAIDRTTVEPALGTSNINWLSDSQYLSMWESQLSIIPDGLGSMPFTFPSGITRSNSYAPGPSTDCGDISETNIAKVAPIPDHTPSSVATTSPLHSQAGSIRSSNASKSTDGALYVEGTMARAPFRGKLLGRHMEQRRGSTMTEAASINGAQDLIDEDGQMISASVHVSEDLYSTLVMSAGEHIENHGLNSTATLIPPLGHIRCFVRLYYENFHDTYPFLRKSASIWQDTGNWLLLLAVSTIGAKYLGGTWSTSMSKLLETILEHKLDVMSRGSNQNSRDTWIPGALKSQPQLDLTILQAMILNLIHRIHSGQKNLIERALSQRSILVEECRRMRLLSRTPPQIDIGTVNDTSFIAAWLKAQSELRTGLMLWVSDHTRQPFFLFLTCRDP